MKDDKRGCSLINLRVRERDYSPSAAADTQRRNFLGKEKEKRFLKGKRFKNEFEKYLL